MCPAACVTWVCACVYHVCVSIVGHVPMWVLAPARVCQCVPVCVCMCVCVCVCCDFVVICVVDAAWDLLVPPSRRLARAYVWVCRARRLCGCLCVVSMS